VITQCQVTAELIRDVRRVYQLLHFIFIKLIILFHKSYQAVMFLKKEIIIPYFIITLSASNIYMPMIWLYVFLVNFLILFLCDPDSSVGLDSEGAE
jgi:hypothetical protein